MKVFEKGEVVYCPKFGYGTINEVRPKIFDGCVRYEVIWNDGGATTLYYEDGKFWDNPSCYAENNTDPIKYDLEKLVFKVGEEVISLLEGRGTVTEVYGKNSLFPVVVKFESGCSVNYTLVGAKCLSADAKPEENIHHIGILHMQEDAVHDAVNPSHYNVAGVQQPIEVMKKLMTKEQYEGFLWGNIIKYAHRYGRKGDKKETAGKIAQYAKWLQEV